MVWVFIMAAPVITCNIYLEQFMNAGLHKIKYPIKIIYLQDFFLSILLFKNFSLNIITFVVFYHYWRMILHMRIINSFTHLTLTRHLRSPVPWTHTSLAMACILGMQNSILWSLNLILLYPPTFCCNSYFLVSYVKARIIRSLNLISSK